MPEENNLGNCNGNWMESISSDLIEESPPTSFHVTFGIFGPELLVPFKTAITAPAKQGKLTGININHLHLSRGLYIF